MKLVLVLGMMIAVFMVVFHILAITPSPAQALYGQISSTAMFAFLAISLLFISGIFLSLARQLKNEKGALNYTATTGLGLVLLLVALTLRKVMDTMLPNLLVDTLSLVSLVLVVVGAWYQTSVSMSPGIVFDAATKKPLANALVRAIRANDNKLLETRRTITNGRYGLLIEPGEYMLNVIAPGYASYTSEKMVIIKPTLVGRDISLTRNA